MNFCAKSAKPEPPTKFARFPTFRALFRVTFGIPFGTAEIPSGMDRFSLCDRLFAGVVSELNFLPQLQSFRSSRCPRFSRCPKDPKSGKKSGNSSGDQFTDIFANGSFYPSSRCHASEFIPPSLGFKSWAGFDRPLVLRRFRLSAVLSKSLSPSSSPWLRQRSGFEW